MTRREWLAASLTGVTTSVIAGARSAAASQGPPAPADPTTLGIAELGAAFTAGRLTPIDVTAAYLARIDRDNPALNAYVTVTRERAVDDMRRLLAQWTAGAPRHPLAGVPIAHKDLFTTRGIRTTGGSRLYETYTPERDATVVARLAGAGTVLLGKTNTHELGGGVTTINPFYGTTRNPLDRTRIPGGSSGGSAAAVAGRLALAATGSDTGGSVRIPAALCGCVGLKPTFGLVSTHGLLGACPTFDHAGVLTRSVEDAARMLAAMAGHDPSDPHSIQAPPVDYLAAIGRGVQGLRIGVTRAYFFDQLEPEVADAVNAALARLRSAGASVRDVRLPIAPDLFDTMFGPIVTAEIQATYAEQWKARPDRFSKAFAATFGEPAPTPQDVQRAREARAAFERQVTALFDEVDVLAMPAVPAVAPRIDGPIDGMRLLRNTWPFNAARGPAISVPAGTGADNLPVGLQVVAAPLAEALLLRVAAAVAVQPAPK
jgi:aspartyl-tRNA(Asn)/glutamyl-tRNA(Gln) amidotransferase subunit A